MRVLQRVALDAAGGALHEDPVRARRDEGRVRGAPVAREAEQRALRREVAQEHRPVRPPRDEAALAGRGADGEDRGLLRLELVSLHHLRLGLGARPRPEPGRDAALLVAHDQGVAAECPLGGGQWDGADCRDVGQPGGATADLPLVELAALRGADERAAAAEAQVRDRVARLRTDGLERGRGRRLALGRRRDAREHDLVVAEQGRDRLLALGRLLVAHLADRPLLGVHLDRSAVAQLHLEVLQRLALEHGPEAHLQQRDAAVARAGGDEVPLQAARRGGHGGAVEAGDGELALPRAVAHPEEDHLRVRGDLIEVHLVLVHPHRERDRGGPTRRRKRQCAEPLPLRRPEEGQGLGEDEHEDEQDAQDDEDAAGDDHAGGRPVDELHPGDPLRRGRHPLAYVEADRGHGVSGSGQER